MNAKLTGLVAPKLLLATVMLATAVNITSARAAAQQAGNAQVRDQGTNRGEPGAVRQQQANAPTAERASRLRQVIELDQQKLQEAKQQLANQQTFFDSLSARVSEAQTQLAAKQQQLEALGAAAASPQAADLASEIESLENRITLGKSELELRFSAVQTLKDQIQALQKKIADDQSSLDALLGPAMPMPDSAETSRTATPAAGEAALEPKTTESVDTQSAASPGQLAPRTERAETAEQIEARREAEELEAEAQRAEQELVSFVERKRALGAQIDMEQSLLETAKASRKNLDAALAVGRADLQRLISQGASKAALQKAEAGIDNIQRLLSENRDEIDQRRAYLDSLYEQREHLNEEQLAVTEQVESKREQAGEARQRSVWLDSPLHPRNILKWLLERGPRILLVVILAWILLALIRFSTRRIARTLVDKMVSGRKRGTNRADTLALSFQSVSSLLVVVAATLLAFQEAGVDIKTVLGGAAILGVAFAFGAQNLMRDYFTGLMIVLEDQYELGDLITIGTITGTVEKVNMRTTVLRDLEGRVHFIPNGEIKSVTNRTYQWGRALLEIPVAFSEDADHVMKVIREVEEEFRTDPEIGNWIIEEPVMLGVDKFTEYGMIIKTFVQTQPDKIFQTRRELLRRIKKRFDEEGIEISVPHRKLLQTKAT